MWALHLHMSVTQGHLTYIRGFMLANLLQHILIKVTTYHRLVTTGIIRCYTSDLHPHMKLLLTDRYDVNCKVIDKQHSEHTFPMNTNWSRNPRWKKTNKQLKSPPRISCLSAQTCNYWIPKPNWLIPTKLTRDLPKWSVWGLCSPVPSSRT
jgi:hypothetical protein